MVLQRLIVFLSFCACKLSASDDVYGDTNSFPSRLGPDQRQLVDSRFALPTVVSAYLPAPFITAGRCQKGTKYRINKVSDLYNFLDQLECVFTAGLTPSRVGLGYNYGTLLMAANTAWPATVSETVYQGDYIVKTWCSGAYYNIGMLNIAGLDVGTANWYIGNLPGQVADGEYWDGKPSIIADFRVDVKSLCPVEGNELPKGLQGFVPFRNSIPPINAYVDVARVVGRDSRDGGLIFLAKAYSTSSAGYSTTLYYALKNFDSRVYVIDDYGTERIFAPTSEGEEIFVSQDFTYSRKGVRAAIEGLPTSIDILGMQKRVAERNAIETFMANSLGSEAGFARFFGDVGSGFFGDLQDNFMAAASNLPYEAAKKLEMAQLSPGDFPSSMNEVKNRLADMGAKAQRDIQHAITDRDL